MCFTCSAKVRTPLNSPLVGAKEYLSSGIASAAETTSCSTTPYSMLRTEVTVGGCCWAVETTIRRSLFYEVNAKILCFCGQRSHPQVFTGRSLQLLLHQSY